MERIKEVIVVEGKNDEAKVKQVFDCDVFLTYGYHISQNKLSILKNIASNRGLILLLDPDTVGEKIRKKINDAIPNCKNAFIAKLDARTEKKVGIEHASNEEVKNAIASLLTYKPFQEHISMAFLDSLELRNTKQGSINREKLSRALHLGHCNFKSLYKKLNMLEISEAEIIRIVKEG